MSFKGCNATRKVMNMWMNYLSGLVWLVGRCRETKAFNPAGRQKQIKRDSSQFLDAGASQ